MLSRTKSKRKSLRNSGRKSFKKKTQGRKRRGSGKHRPSKVDHEREKIYFEQFKSSGLSDYKARKEARMAALMAPDASKRYVKHIINNPKGCWGMGCS